MAAPVRLIQVDAFADAPFRGNPAAVALFAPDDERLDDDALLQAVALEMNLSETAFPRPRPDGDWDLRWFTPAAEVDLCGHATLATAHALFTEGLVGTDHVTFHTRSGPLICRRSGGASGDGAAQGGVGGSRPDPGTTVVMDFPAADVDPIEADPALADALDRGLGLTPVALGSSFDLVVHVEGADAVARLQPDIGALAEIDTRAVVVTAEGDVGGGPAHFVSRVFGPRVGIAEDPVTGSAHTILAPWWSSRLGRTDFAAHQVSPRGGRLAVRLVGDRVELEGRAVTVLDGRLLL